MALRRKRMTKAEGRAYKRRWEAVNRFQIEELRATPVEEKFRQLALLMRVARAWPWTPKQLALEAAEVEQVRARWARLREALGG